MDFFVRLIDSWLWFVYFSFTSKEIRQNQGTAPMNVKIIYSFKVLRACKEIHTPTLGLKLTSAVCMLLIKINWSKSKVKLHRCSKSISTTKCVITPLFKIKMNHEMSNRAPTPNQFSPPGRTWTRGLQHVNWVFRQLHHQSLTLSS